MKAERFILLGTAFFLSILLIFTFIRDAQAAIPNRIVQDERVITEGSDAQRELALRQAKDAGFNTVRMILNGYQHIPKIENAARQIRARGFSIMVSISGQWYRDSYATNPSGYFEYARTAARQLAPYVDTYTIWNEPDLAIPNERVCGYQYKNITKRIKYKRGVRFKRLKLGRRIKLYKRVVVKKKKLRRKRAKGPAMVKAGIYRVKIKGKKKRKRMKVYRERIFRVKFHGCQTWNSADRYRGIYRAGYVAIKDADPTARILLGDTSPGAGGFSWQQRLFGMIPGAGGTARLIADGYAHHPYDGNRNPFIGPSYTSSGLSRCTLHQDLLREAARAYKVGLPGRSRKPLPLAYTEFGYQNRYRPGWDTISDEKIASWLPKAWDTAEKCGATDMTQYHWWNTHLEHPWNSGIFTEDGQPLVSYWALKKYLTAP